MITRKFLSSLNFRQFNHMDWSAFSGCNHPIPLIHEDEKMVVILDGNYCEVYVNDDQIGDGTYEPQYTCENVSELPYQYHDEWDGANEASPIGVR